VEMEACLLGEGVVEEIYKIKIWVLEKFRLR